MAVVPTLSKGYDLDYIWKHELPATTGILVTTSWVTKDGHDFAQRHGRIRLIECEEIKYLCKEHLDLDVLISLPKPPPKRR